MLQQPDEDEQPNSPQLIDLQSEVGYIACVKFLSALEAAAEALHVEVAARSYRKGFSLNYRAIFPDCARHYRADVMEVCMDRHSSIWVNGEKYELSSEATACAERLQHAFAELGMLLERWVAAARGEQQASAEAISASHPSRTQLLSSLAAIDFAWANFEHCYITDLIAVENRARQVVARAVEAEQWLRSLEGPRGVVAPQNLNRHREAQRSLVACISQLNAVANCRRKGRDDLTDDILESAIVALKRSELPEHATTSRAAQVLAGDIVGAFGSIRQYLRQVKVCLERVDPHLCNNNGLVSRLVDWEESWEVAGRYVRDARLLDALCLFVAKIQGIQVALPELATMCEECDVELFMVLPRITLLCFLKDPSGTQGQLLKLFLPHRFQQGMPNTELQVLLRDFRSTIAALDGLVVPASGIDVDSATWQALVTRAVGGSQQAALNVLGALGAKQREPAGQLLEVFSLKLEGWSLELQRHCPEDWNQCSAVLVQCLTGTSKRQLFSKFQV